MFYYVVQSLNFSNDVAYCQGSIGVKIRIYYNLQKYHGPELKIDLPVKLKYAFHKIQTCQKLIA